MYPSNAQARRVSPRRLKIFLMGLLLALTWSTPSYSVTTSNHFEYRTEVDQLTLSLVRLNSAYQRAAPESKEQALQQLIHATIQRQALLSELIKMDPGAVLRAAMPERVRKEMPAEVKDFMEQRVNLEGQLEVVIEDFADGSHRIRHALNAGKERISLHFDSQPTQLLSGSSIQISGVLVDDALAVRSGDKDVLILALDGTSNGGTQAGSSASLLPNSIGEQRIAVIMVNFDSNPSEPWTAEEARDVVFNQADAFFQENSQNQTWLTGDVFGWFTLALDPAGCPSMDIAIQARQAANASGADLSGYDRYVYAFPDIRCPWSGEATVGDLPSNTWLDGTLNSPGTVSHELGHNLGLFHSHALACVGDLTVGDNCTEVEYGDVLDRMGSSGGGHFNAFQKERLGWLNYGDLTHVVTAAVSGSYALDPYAEPGNGVKAIRIPKDSDPLTGQPRWYYLESRQSVGFDDFLGSSEYGESVTNGVVFRLSTQDDANSSFLLDMTPASQYYDWHDLALPMGASYTDLAAGVTVMVEEVNSFGATVQVSYGPQSCLRSDPTVAVAPSGSDWVVPGTPVIYTVTVTNNDSDACDGATFQLFDQIPTGWSASFASASVYLLPNGSTSTNLTVTSASNAADGTYDITVTASQAVDSNLAASGSAVYTVLADTGSTNSAPVAVNDDVVIAQVAPVTIDVLANDWDPDNNVVWLSGFSQGVKGSVVDNADGTLTYSPGKRFKNKDSFSYQISDGVDSATATVSVTLESTSNDGGKGGGKGGGKPNK